MYAIVPLLAALDVYVTNGTFLTADHQVYTQPAATTITALTAQTASGAKLAASVCRATYMMIGKPLL
jgi:hypothetical protein